MTEILRLPYLGTAEEDVLFVDWFVAEGEAFKKGQPLAVVETLKASFEVEAERDGEMQRLLVQPGARVPVHAAIGAYGAAGEVLDESRLAELLAELEVPAPAVGVEEPSASESSGVAGVSVASRKSVAPAARRRARELGVDPESLHGTGPEGMVRVVDVEAATPAASSGDGALDREFYAHLCRDGAAFAALSSEFKVALYRKHGAIIGTDAHLAPGALLTARHIVLGDGAYFGRDVQLEAGELIAGDLLHFGPRCRVRCTRLQFGDNAFFTEDVEVGGGGAMDPEAELIVGSHGFVGEHVHLNPCRTLHIGDEVVVSRNAVVMTHSFGASALRGYPSRFAGVTLGDGCQVGIHAVLFPGVEMGAGSILLSGSSLVSSMPAGRLFGGVPAVDMKAAAQPLHGAAFAARSQELVAEFGRQLELRGMDVSCTTEGAETQVTVSRDGSLHRLRFSTAAFAATGQTLAEEVWVAPRMEPEAWEALPPEVVGMDLDRPEVRGPMGPMGAAFREFLRKRGVRMHPRSWAYKGGWL